MLFELWVSNSQNCKKNNQTFRPSKINNQTDKSLICFYQNKQFHQNQIKLVAFMVLKNFIFSESQESLGRLIFRFCVKSILQNGINYTLMLCCNIACSLFTVCLSQRCRNTVWFTSDNNVSTIWISVKLRKKNLSGYVWINVTFLLYSKEHELHVVEVILAFFFHFTV